MTRRQTGSVRLPSTRSSPAGFLLTRIRRIRPGSSARASSGGSVSGLNWLCRTFPEREIAILEHWCRMACEGRHLWAWREARERLEGLVARGEAIPAPLAQFAIEPPPAATPGPAPEGSRAMLCEFLVRGFEEAGFEPHEINGLFGEAFPSSGKDPGTTLRKRRAKGRPFVVPVFGADRDVEPVPSPPSRALDVGVDWDDPVEASLVLLTSRWPALALLSDFWPDRYAQHVRLWCTRARSDAWVWDEVRVLLDQAIYCGWSVASLSSFVGLARPANPPGRPVDYGRWVRVAAIEARCAEVVRSERAAQYLVQHAFDRARKEVVSPDLRLDLGLDLDPSRVRRNFILGREQLGGVSAYTFA